MYEDNNATIPPETAKGDMEKTIKTEPETAKAGAEKGGLFLSEPPSGEDGNFVEEVLIKDHTDYESDWSEFDVSSAGEKDADIEDAGDGRISRYEQEIKKLKKKREQFDNHSARMRNKMKNELRKDRNARLVMWGAEFEYQVGKRSPNIKKLLPYLGRDMQKKIIWHIFAEIRTGSLIIDILKDYTKDIKDILPDDLRPYAE